MLTADRFLRMRAVGPGVKAPDSSGGGFSECPKPNAESCNSTRTSSGTRTGSGRLAWMAAHTRTRSALARYVC